jgi:hypothetical protein
MVDNRNRKSSNLLARQYARRNEGKPRQQELNETQFEYCLGRNE